MLTKAQLQDQLTTAQGELNERNNTLQPMQEEIGELRAELKTVKGKARKLLETIQEPGNTSDHIKQFAQKELDGAEPIKNLAKGFIGVIKKLEGEKVGGELTRSKSLNDLKTCGTENVKVISL